MSGRIHLPLPPEGTGGPTELTPPAHLIGEVGVALGLGGAQLGAALFLLRVCACPVIRLFHYWGSQDRDWRVCPPPGTKLPCCLLTEGGPPIQLKAGDLQMLASFDPLTSCQTPRTTAGVGSCLPAGSKHRCHAFYSVLPPQNGWM